MLANPVLGAGVVSTLLVEDAGTLCRLLAERAASLWALGIGFGFGVGLGGAAPSPTWKVIALEGTPIGASSGAPSRPELTPIGIAAERTVND